MTQQKNPLEGLETKVFVFPDETRILESGINREVPETDLARDFAGGVFPSYRILQKIISAFQVMTRSERAEAFLNSILSVAEPPPDASELAVLKKSLQDCLGEEPITRAAPTCRTSGFTTEEVSC